MNLDTGSRRSDFGVNIHINQKQQQDFNSINHTSFSQRKSTEQLGVTGPSFVGLKEAQTPERSEIEIAAPYGEKPKSKREQMGEESRSKLFPRNILSAQHSGDTTSHYTAMQPMLVHTQSGTLLKNIQHMQSQVDVTQFEDLQVQTF